MASPADHSLECGCRYIRVGGKWWQVVSCPDHVFNFAASDEKPGEQHG